MRDFLDLIAKYVSGEQPSSVIEEWLAGVDWDDTSLNEDDKEIFGLFELLTTEVSEGIREEQELTSEATRLLTKQGRIVFLRDAPAEVISWASTVATSAVMTIMIGGGQNQKTWNISPQLVIL